MTSLTYDNLLGAPELGVMLVLEAAIDVAIVALAAAHPELRDDAQYVTVPAAESALDVIDCARALGVLLKRYRLALALPSEHSGDWPF